MSKPKPMTIVLTEWKTGKKMNFQMVNFTPDNPYEKLAKAIYVLFCLLKKGKVQFDYGIIRSFMFNPDYPLDIDLDILSRSIFNKDNISDCNTMYGTTQLSDIKYVKLIVPLFAKDKETEYCPIILPFFQTEEYNTKTVAKIIYDNYEGTKDDLLQFIQLNDCIEPYLKRKYSNL
jgi:hypothetical protein